MMGGKAYVGTSGWQYRDRRRAFHPDHIPIRIWATARPNDASFVYVRRHGSTGQAKGRHTKKRLQKEAKRSEEWLEEGNAVFIRSNNDEKGYAAMNACEPQETLTADAC